MFPSQASPKRNKKRKDERKQMRYVSKYSIPCLQSGSKPHLESVRIQVSLGREYDQFGVFLENQAMICFLSCSQSASQQNQAVYCLDSLSIQKTLYPAPTVFLQYQPIKPPSPLISPPTTPRDSAAGSHSSGMNLSRLEHSAKGHYPGLHVCWAAVLSNSTRCCCDHQVTCEGRVSICTSSLSSLLPHLHPSEALSLGDGERNSRSWATLLKRKKKELHVRIQLTVGEVFGIPR